MNTKKSLFTGFLTVLPLALLLAGIVLYQNSLVGNSVANQGPTPPDTGQLQLVGYSNTSEPSVTLTNVGDNYLVISQVIYDGNLLTLGELGGALPMMALGNESSLCLQPSDTLVFPQSNHWNMDTGGLCTATILPNAEVTLYLGVFSNTHESHQLAIETQSGNFTFTL